MVKGLPDILFILEHDKQLSSLLHKCKFEEKYNNRLLIDSGAFETLLSSSKKFNNLNRSLYVSIRYSEENLTRVCLFGEQISIHKKTWGIISCGNYLSAKRLDAFVNDGLKNIFLNLNGLVDTQDLIHNQKDSFIDTVLTISNVNKNTSLETIVFTCINEESLSELSEMHKLLESLSVKKWFLFKDSTDYFSDHFFMQSVCLSFSYKEGFSSTRCSFLADKYQVNALVNSSDRSYPNIQLFNETEVINPYYN